MLDIKFIRENPEKIKQACENKQIKVDIPRLLELDKKKRELLQEIEDLRHQKNLISGSDPVKGAKELKYKIRTFEDQFKEIDKEFNDLMLLVPNLPFANVPLGKDEKDNKVVKKYSKPPKFNFGVRTHLELGQHLGIVDVERAAKVSGTRFNYLKGEAVQLEFALIKLTFDLLIKKGFAPVIPPVMIKQGMARGTGYFEAEDAQEAYFLPDDKLYLIGTSEQSMAAMHADEIFEEKELPKRYVGFSPCFRREAGSYGKDTKGIFRVHQFDKVEMFVFCKPENSNQEHQFLLSLEEEIMKKLALPYQMVNICTGDLGRPAASKYDIETWLPSQNKYRETHSCSNCTDFQARRLNIRYRNKTGKLGFVHTLNGTALAIGRTIIAVLENYQQKDGGIEVPKVLRGYMGLKKIEAK